MALLSRLPRRVRLAGRFAVALIAVGLAAGIPAAAAAESRSRDPGEYEVKAAFLYNFTKFVEWPPEAFADAEAPLVLCVVGEDPFGPALDRVVTGETVGGRPLAVERPRASADLGQCHLLFVSSSQKARFAAILSPLKHASVLTVGEAEGFLEAGGLLRFVLEGGKVRFRANPEAVAAAPLKVSSKLLRLASAPLEGSR